MSKSAPTLSTATFLRYVPLLLKDRAEGLRTIARKHGDVVRVPVPGKAFYLVSSPSDARRIFQGNSQNYRKSFDVSIVSDLLGSGLITSHGEEWKEARQTGQPAFRQHCMHSIASQIASITREEIAGWEGRTRAAHALSRLTLRILAEALLRVRFPEEPSPYLEAFSSCLRYLDQRLVAFVDLAAHFSTPSKRRFERDRARVDELILNWVREKEENPPSSPDLLTLLLAQAADRPDRERWYRDQLVTYVFAGHETVAVALSWTLYLLAGHPDTQARIAIEPSYASLVLREAMRLYPPVWCLGREAIGDDLMSDYRIPAGATVVVSPYVIQRREELWPDADSFIPERFRGNWRDTLPPFSYFPFSAGPRHCLGEAFAWTELEVVLGEIVRSYVISTEPGYEPTKEPLISLRPFPAVPLVLERRGVDSGRQSAAERDISPRA